MGQKFFITEEEKIRIKSLYVMNLQENIDRIKEIMILNEENEIQYIQKTIDKEVLELKNKILKNEKLVLNPDKMINDFKNYLVSKVPVQIEKSKTGKGGEQFAYECYVKLMELVQTQINDISEVKKFTIRQLAPKKQEFLSNSKNVDLHPFFYSFKTIIDFPWLIGSMEGGLEKYKNYEDQMGAYSKQIWDWVDKNQQPIANSVINKVSKFLYE